MVLAEELEETEELVDAETLLVLVGGVQLLHLLLDLVVDVLLLDQVLDLFVDNVVHLLEEGLRVDAVDEVVVESVLHVVVACVVIILH